jgi:hypothetical protein
LIREDEFSDRIDAKTSEHPVVLFYHHNCIEKTGETSTKSIFHAFFGGQTLN